MGADCHYLHRFHNRLNITKGVGKVSILLECLEYYDGKTKPRRGTQIVIITYQIAVLIGRLVDTRGAIFVGPEHTVHCFQFRLTG